MLRIANAHAAAVVNGDPRGATGGVNKSVEEGPIGDGVGAVFHGFGFAIGGSDGTAVEMVASDHDGSFEITFGDEVVESQAELVAFAVAEPADAGRKSLKFYFLLRHLDPALEMLIFREHFEYELIGARDVGSFAGKRGPTEWTFAFAEERANVGRNESGKVVSVLDSGFMGEGANVVAVVKGDGAKLLQVEHALDVLGHGGDGVFAIFLRIGRAEFDCFGEGHAIGDVAADGIVGAGLIGENVGNDAALGEFGNEVGTI